MKSVALSASRAACIRPLRPARYPMLVGAVAGWPLVVMACAPSSPRPATPPTPAPAAVAARPDTLAATSTRGSAVVQLKQSIDSLLDDPRFHNAFWGVLIVDPTTGDTLYARNAHRLFLPASNMKVITQLGRIDPTRP